MTWNYRVVKEQAKLDEDAWCSIREVYYDKKGEIISWSADDIAPGGETVEELLEVLQLMRNCLDKPVLVETDGGLKDAE